MLAGVQPKVDAAVDVRGVGHEVRRVARDLAPGVAVYVGIRVLGLVALALFARAHGVDGLARLDTYDAPRLLGLASHGYDPLGPYDAAGRPLHSNIAFLPLYPLVVRVIAGVPGIGVLAAGFVVTALAGLAAAVGLDRLGRQLVVGRSRRRLTLAPQGAEHALESADGAELALEAAGRGSVARRARITGLALVALWACWPHSAVLAMPYTEPLFVALAAWSLVALLHGRWITAGVLCLLAGATRPFGIALAAALVAAALAATVRALRDRRRPEAQPLVAAVLAPLGFLGYWGWLWLRTGRPDAWFWVQANEWRSTFDGGRFTLAAVHAAANGRQALVLSVCAVVVVVSVLLLVLLVVQGAPLPVLVYTALATYLVIGAAGYENSKPRFLLCAFPLLVPLARVLARVWVPVVVVLITGLVLLSAWYNAYLLVTWPYSP
jgi:hypothetical protein